LVHELSAKCGRSDSFNAKVDAAYAKWRDSKGKLNLIDKYPDLARDVAKMRFKDLHPHFRTDEEITLALNRGGFNVELFEPAIPGREENWFIAVVRAGSGSKMY